MSIMNMENFNILTISHHFPSGATFSKGQSLLQIRLILKHWLLVNAKCLLQPRKASPLIVGHVTAEGRFSISNNLTTPLSNKFGVNVTFCITSHF